MKTILSTQTWLVTLVLIFVPFASACAQSLEEKYPFPELPYAYQSLEPAIDAQTMEVHYNKHHRGYYTNFLKAVNKAEMTNLSMEEIFAQASKLPVFLRNNAGGYYNHCLFWESLSPISNQVIPTKLKKVLEDHFGSIERFKGEFSHQAASVFGSGWTWLVATPKGELLISSTPNQDNPLMDDAEIKGTPLLALDVWEHAYYLKYQNKRINYIDAFWSIVNWNVVEKRLMESVKR
ncbi:MAG: superoxide dismutase [Mangrovibacterium sp.]